MLDDLKQQVWQANLDLVETGLVILTWGNASGVDRERGVMVIKPSGVPYGQLQPADLVAVSLADGSVLEGELSPSSDTATHRALYQAFPAIGGIVHTHSPGAVAWAQAGRAIPCLGTTHADHFAGPVPVTRQLTPAEIAGAYEENIGAVIVECFRQGRLDPDTVPAVLVPGHGPFTWGKDAAAAVRHAVILEAVADMARSTLALNPSAAIPKELADKHFRRKHGPDAYYGQPG
jgi:L-ribulose-5-phosphate 4-epimerase